MPAIVAHGIDMVFSSGSQRFQALNAVELAVPQGAVQLIMGPSGAGKTTLLLIVSGLLSPTKGQVKLLEQNITQMSRSELTHFRLHNLGIAWEDNHLLRALTALENIEIILKFKGVRDGAARRQAHDLLDAVDLGDKANVLPRYLSGGQQQRVAVARALAGQPAVVIADEPTSALDSQNGRIIGGLLHDLAKRQGSTVLIATHDPRLIPFADWIAYLEDGVITDNQRLPV